MKYRRLTLDELTEMKAEFVHFLASQSIPSADWEKMKIDKPMQAEQMIELFSDIVLEKVLGNIDLLELRKRDKLVILKCNDYGIEMRGLQIEGGRDFSLSETVTQARMEAFLKTPNSKIEILRGEKKYTKSRGEEVFELLQQGYLISKNHQLFENLST